MRLPVIQAKMERRTLVIGGACALSAFAIAGCSATDGAMELGDPDAGDESPPDSGDLSAPDAGELGQDASAMDSSTAVPDAGVQAMDAGSGCTGRTQIGSVSDFALGHWTLLMSHSVIVGHDAGGLFAFSAVCT